MAHKDCNQLRAFDPFEECAIENTRFPGGSVIHVRQRVRDITDGSERDLYIAALSLLPNGDFEITTRVGEDQVFIDVMTPAHPSKSPLSKGKRGKRS